MPTLRNLNTSCCQGCWLESVGFGALLLGYYNGEKMVFAGKVGTGFNEGILSRLGRELAQLETKTSPFAAGDAPSRGVHWVRPISPGATCPGRDQSAAPRQETAGRICASATGWALL